MRKTSEYAELHLVVEEGPSGILYIEAWRDHASQLSQVAQEGNIPVFTNLTLKATGEEAQLQCSDLDVYGHLLASAQVERGADDGSCPEHKQSVLLLDFLLSVHGHLSGNAA